MGMKMVRETENPEKMIPIQIPDAPKLSAYMGSRGTMIPTPSMDEKMEKNRTTKTFFFKRVAPLGGREAHKFRPPPIKQDLRK